MILRLRIGNRKRKEIENECEGKMEIQQTKEGRKEEPENGMKEETD